MIHILLADDHPIVRDGIRRVLDADEDLHVAHTTADAEETLKVLQAGANVDVAVVDLGMPGDGMNILRALDQVAGNTPILVFSGLDAEEAALSSIQAGAAGYLAKGRSSALLLEAVRAVAEGETWVGPDVTEELLQRVREHRSGKPHLTLSPRETEVFHRIARGERVTDIADDLGVSVKTVSTYRSRILEKLDFANNADIVRYAAENGLLKDRAIDPLTAG